MVRYGGRLEIEFETRRNNDGDITRKYGVKQEEAGMEIYWGDREADQRMYKWRYN